MPKEDPSNDISNTKLALERTHLAQERTLMAWIRTSLSMISFGFTIFKFFQYLQESGQAKQQWNAEMPRNVGSILVIVGTVILSLAILQHWKMQKELQRQMHQKMPVSLSLITALFITCLGILAILNVLFRIGGF